MGIIQQFKEKVQTYRGLNKIKNRLKTYQEKSQQDKETQNKAEIFGLKQEAIKTILIINEQLDLNIKDEQNNKIEMQDLNQMELEDITELLQECITLLEQEQYKKE